MSVALMWAIAVTPMAVALVVACWPNRKRRA